MYSSLSPAPSRSPRTRFAARGQALCASLRDNSLRRRFALGAAWSLGAAIVSQGSSLLGSVFCARILGQKGFGELGFVQSTLVMFGALAGVGLGLTTVKHVAEFRMIDPLRTGRIIGCTTLVAIFTGGATTLLLLLFAPLLSLGILNTPQLVPELRIASFLIVFTSVSGTQTGALAGFEAFRMIAGVNLVNGLISLALTITGVLLGRLEGAVWALVISAAIGCGISSIALRRVSRPRGVSVAFGGAWRERRILWTFTLPAYLSDIVLSPVSWISNTILVQQPNGYAEMGIFSAASQWRSSLLFVPLVLGQVLTPITSSLSRHNRNSVRAAMVSTLLVNALCATPVMTVLLFFSKAVMNLYGPSFGGHGAVLKLTAATGALVALLVPFGNLFAGLGRMWPNALMNLGWAVLMVSSAWWLVRHGRGAEGLALAYLLAYSVHAVWTFWFGFRLLNSLNRPGTVI